MKHEIEVRKILSTVTPSGNLRSRESNTVEFKEFDSIKIAQQSTQKLWQLMPIIVVAI